MNRGPGNEAKLGAITHTYPTTPLIHLASSLNKSLRLVERITKEVMDLHLPYLSNIHANYEYFLDTIVKLNFKAGIGIFPKCHMVTSVQQIGLMLLTLLSCEFW